MALPTHARFGATLLLALGVGAGCSDYATITYRLERAGGDTLPVLLREEGGCRHVLNAGEVVFRGNRNYISSFNIDIRCGNRPPRAAPEIGTAGRMAIRRDTAFFSDSLGNRTGYGVLSADSLVVQGPVHRLTYRRDLER